MSRFSRIDHSDTSFIEQTFYKNQNNSKVMKEVVKKEILNLLSQSFEILKEGNNRKSYISIEYSSLSSE